MTTFLLVLSLAGNLVILYVVNNIWTELESIRRLLQAKPLPSISVGKKKTVLTNSTLAILVAYAIWVWRDGQWQLDLSSIPAGYEPGKSPSFQGTYPGQRIKTECMRRGH